MSDSRTLAVGAEVYLIRTAAAADGGAEVLDAAILARAVPGRPLAWELLAVGPESEVERHPAARAAMGRQGEGGPQGKGGAGGLAIAVDLRGGSGRRCVVIPGLVNAHTHLDLTHIGPRRHDPREGFIPWVDVIRRERRMTDEGIAESVRRGIDLSLAGGTVAVGDVSGSIGGGSSLAPWHELRQAGLLGVSFMEFFAIGTARARRMGLLERQVQEWAGLNEDLRPDRDARIGLQPHAPYSVDRRAYLWAAREAARQGMALATHLAETAEEIEFVRSGSGPQRMLLERLGAWDESILEELGRGEHPVDHLRAVLEIGPLTAVHVNDAGPRQIEALARAGATVAYCPRASEYFAAEARFGPHRYRDMLEAGVNVCLGTDSIVSLGSAAEAGTGGGEGGGEWRGGGMSVLDEMRLLHRRDGMDPRRLVEMATVNGARALGLDPSWFRLTEGGRVAGLVAIEPGGPERGKQGSPDHAARGLAAALAGEAPAMLLTREKLSGLAGRSRP